MNRKGLGSLGMGILLLLAAFGGAAALDAAGVINLSGATAPSDDGKMTSVDDDGVANLQIKAKHVLDDSETYAATSYEVVNPDGIEVASGTLSSSSFTNVPDLDEETTYTVRVYEDNGSGSDYYVASKQVTTSETGKYVIVDAKKEGSATLTVKEDDGTSDDGTITVQKGETQTVTLQIEEGMQNAAFNQPAVFVKTNSTSAITDINVQEASSIEVPSRLTSYSDGFDPAISEIVDFGQKSVTVEITRSDSNGNQATVTLLVADKTGFENDQGQWVPGYEDGSDNDVGAADASTTVTVK